MQDLGGKTVIKQIVITIVCDDKEVVMKTFCDEKMFVVQFFLWWRKTILMREKNIDEETIYEKNVWWQEVCNEN